MRELKDQEVVGYFYGSNIHPREEYERRAEALTFLAGRENVPVLMRPWNPDEWFARASGLADEPERGRRCALCFALQLAAAADAAVERGAGYLCTTLTISPHKDVALITRLGKEAAAARGLIWEDRIWRKQDGFLRSLKICEELGLYRQRYCGCRYSIRKGSLLNESKGEGPVSGHRETSAGHSEK